MDRPAVPAAARSPRSRLSLYLMSAFYVGAGANHFLNPAFYLAIIPPALPWKPAVNAASGLAEILLGVALLHPRTRRAAAWGLIALLVAVFPANVYHYSSGGAGMDIPPLALLLRLPLQVPLLYWAWTFARPDRPASPPSSLTPPAPSA
jgi:uncharacterized membrane protein